RFRTDTVPELCVHYLALNTQKYPFTDPGFRRALNLAIDRPAIIAALFKNRYTPAAGPVPPHTGTYQGGISPIPYDPEAARALIKKTGMEGKTVTLSCKAEHQVSLTAQMIQVYLEKAGLKIEIREMEWGSLKTAANAGKYDIALFNWYGDYPDAENFLRPLFHSENRGSGGNRAFFSDPVTDRLIDRAGSTVSEKERNDLYRQAEQRIVDQAPWVFLWYGGRKIAFSRRVESFTSYPVYNGMKGNDIILR
ncbi:MAG: ABC transporter substrate-binding protein, partial [Spirochaetota bacterium]